MMEAVMPGRHENHEPFNRRFVAAIATSRIGIALKISPTLPNHINVHTYHSRATRAKDIAYFLNSSCIVVSVQYMLGILLQAANCAPSTGIVKYIRLYSTVPHWRTSGVWVMGTGAAEGHV